MIGSAVTRIVRLGLGGNAVITAAGVLLIGWLLNTPAGLLGKADAVGYAVCHRIAGHSFLIGERPISLCARCTGMYLGALAALFYLALIGGKRSGLPRKWTLAVLALMGTAFVVDGINSWLWTIFGSGMLYEPDNALRLITGTGMGLVMASVLYPTFNETVWRESVPGPSIKTVGEFAGLLAVGAVTVMLVLSDNPLILYPLTLVSAGGVLVLLTTIYCMMLMMVMKIEKRIEHSSQLVWPLTGGFILAMLQIALFDMGRYLLTGTWEGFHVVLG